MISSYRVSNSIVRPIVMAVLLLLDCLLIAGPASAQTIRATILGTVIDEKGAVVPNAQVTAVNRDTGISRDAVTDSEGRYRIGELAPGRYEVKAAREGFKLEVRSGIDLAVGHEAVINFTLKVGSINEMVMVEGNAPLVETTSSAVKWLVNKKQIEELPLNGRDVLQLATLQSGAVSTAAITTTPEAAGPGTTRLSVNGARIDSNTYLLDGTETVDGFGMSPGGLGGGFLGVDAIREFEVLTSNYSAEYGQGGGAIINAVTKSGSNDFHGTAFIFHRNSALDARNFFNQEKLPFKRNQFGGSLGGPLLRDRTFFFGSYEGLRRREGTSNIFNVPSPEARRGNLTSGQVTVDPRVRPYLDLYPLPNGPISGDTGIFRRDFNELTNEDFFTVRLDHHLTSRHSIFGRYTFDDSELHRVSSVIMDQILENRNQYLTLEQQSVLSNRALNVVRFGFSRSDFRSDFPFTVPVAPELGFIPGHRMGGFSISGVAPLRTSTADPRRFVLNTFELNNQFIYTRGGHSIKAGSLIRRYQLNADSAIVSDGLFIVGGGLDRLLTARPSVFLAAAPGTDFYRAIRQWLFGFYLQDDWRVSRNLTLNLGLRYEPISTPSEANGKIANLRNLTDSSPTVGPPFIENPSKRNFGPRVGFAWDPTGSGRLAIRGGFGIFYAALRPMQYRFQMSSFPPFARLLFLPGIFPDAFSRALNSPLPVPGLLWAMQFEAEQPTVYQWNLSVQNQIGENLALSVGYIGSRGVHLQTGDSTNVRRDSQIINGRRFFPEIPGSQIQLNRVNPNFGTIQLLGFNADSFYHALQLAVNKRYSDGLQFQASYTFSKSIDTGSASETVFTNGIRGGDRQDPFNARPDRGQSDFNPRHNFMFNFWWDLPIGRERALGGNLAGLAGKLLEGWALGGILNFRSGFPFGPSLGFDRARNGIDNVQSQRPDLAPGRSYKNAVTGDPNRYVDPTIFQLQPAGFYGNAARNSLIGPDLRVFDFSLAKRTAINERIGTEFRFEVFNIFNHTNFAPPDLDNRVVFTGVDPRTGRGIVPASFAQLTRTATSSRQIQFGLKFIW